MITFGITCSKDELSNQVHIEGFLLIGIQRNQTLTHPATTIGLGADRLD